MTVASRAGFEAIALFPAVTLLALLLPVGAGLLGLVLPALGHLPAAGLTGPSLEPLRQLFAWPGLAGAVRLSVATGFMATAIALAAVVLVTAGWSETRAFARLQASLSPLLSVPHAAAAFGLAFLVAPSGWLVRLASPSLTGWDRPPDILVLNDPSGLAMTAGLVVKEIPFLLLMTLAAVSQTDAARRLELARSLGYGRVTGWLKTVFPAVYAQIRLPVYVVLAYSMSVVDVALILGPSTPPPLSVQIITWMGSPDLGDRGIAAAGALVQFALVLAALVVWRCGEWVLGRLGSRWIWSGARGARDTARPFGLAAGLAVSFTVLAGIGMLAIWSVAGYWQFPDPFPETFTLRNWMRHWPDLSRAASTTTMVAFFAVAIGTGLTLGCLEAEHRRRRPLASRGLWLLYLPLLVPQTAFLPGLQTLLLMAGAGQGALAVVSVHLVFVLPYLFLSLRDPWLAWDERHARTAAALGAPPNKVFWQIRLPMLLRPLLTAMAVGAAVSVGQYLPTLLAGAGRIATLTTEAVALSSGNDRRAIGVYGVALTAAALLPFWVALFVPAIVWRHRRGLHV